MLMLPSQSHTDRFSITMSTLGEWGRDEGALIVCSAALLGFGLSLAMLLAVEGSCGEKLDEGRSVVDFVEEMEVQVVRDGLEVNKLFEEVADCFWEVV